MVGVKGRSGGYRAGAGRRPGSVTLTSKKAKAKLKAPTAASVAVLKNFIVRKPTAAAARAPAVPAAPPVATCG